MTKFTYLQYMELERIDILREKIMDIRKELEG